MTKTHLIIPDQHAHPDFNNERANLISQLIQDVRPDTVVNMGDCADFPSLADYDKGKRSFNGRNYKADLEAHLDFQERVWEPVRKAKKKLPYRVVLEGNHEHRIEKVLDQSPILVDTVSFNDLDFDRHYSDVVRYDGNYPAVIEIDGIQYAHYFVSGVMGRPITSLHHAYTLLSKRHVSSTCAHSHLLDYALYSNQRSRHIQGLVAGSFLDYRTGWAGQAQDLWWNGVIIKRNVENGTYDPEFISMAQLKNEYDS